MSNNSKLYEMLEFYNDKRSKQTDDDRITSMTRLEEFKIDKKVDIDMGEVYFVTREKKFENSEDSFMYYEIYSTSDTSMPIAKTNEKFEIEILDKKINNEFLKYKLDLEKEKKVIREMTRPDKKGDLIPTCAVMDKFEPDKKEERGMKQAKKIKEGTVYNDKAEEVEDKEQEILTEEKIKEKSEENGKKIQTMSRIEDPMFYQLVPDASVLTYFVVYDDQTIGIVNSKGVDIAGNDERGIKGGSLSLKKMDRNQIQTDSPDATSMDIAVYIDGASNTHGIVFPIVNTRGNYTMEMKDIYDTDQQSMPLSMQGNGNTKDNRLYLGLDEKIVDILEKNGIEDANEKDVEKIARSFYDKGDNNPDEISVLKEYHRKVNIPSEEEVEEDTRGERKKNENL